MVRPLAETYWLLEEEDMLREEYRVGWVVGCCWEWWVTQWWLQNCIGFYSLECSHSRGPAMLFGPITWHPHDNGLWHQGPLLQGLMNYHDNKLDAYQTCGPGNFLVPTLLASGPLFPPIEWWRFRLPTIGELPECSAPRSGLESGTTSWHDAPMLSPMFSIVLCLSFSHAYFCLCS